MNNQESGCITSCIKLLIALGIVSLIVLLLELPSTLSFFNSRKKIEAEAEAKQYLYSMNKAQQAYYAKNSVFSNSSADLEIDLKSETTNNYRYSISVTKEAVFNDAFPKNNAFKSYTGGVFRVSHQNLYAKAPANEKTSITIICESEKRGIIKPQLPKLEKGYPVCGKGTKEVTK